jgi:hypothetical protein
MKDERNEAAPPREERFFVIEKFYVYVVPWFTYDPKLDPLINLSRTFNTYLLLLVVAQLTIVMALFLKYVVLAFLIVVPLVTGIVMVGLALPRVSVSCRYLRISSSILACSIITDFFVMRYLLIDHLQTVRKWC